MPLSTYYYVKYRSYHGLKSRCKPSMSGLDNWCKYILSWFITIFFVALSCFWERGTSRPRHRWHRLGCGVVGGWLQRRHNERDAFQNTGVTIVYSTVCWGADQRRHQNSASLAFVRGIHWWPVNSPHKGPVMRNMFPFDDVVMHIAELDGN